VCATCAQAISKHRHHIVSQFQSQAAGVLADVEFGAAGMRRHIIQFKGFGLSIPGDLRSAFYVMEHLAGGSLKRYYVKNRHGQRQACFGYREAMRWAIQLSSALAHMHSRTTPVVHRDIKLENVLLTSTNTAEASIKLADFGLAVNLANRKRCQTDDALRELKAALRTGLWLACASLVLTVCNHRSMPCLSPNPMNQGSGLPRHCC
jgi:serine/threonine protein kinase